MRGSITTVATLVTAFMVLQLNTLRLSSRVSELEQTQEHISAALAIVEDVPVANPDEVRALAERLRGRQDELLRLVETLSVSLTAENAQLWQELQLAGVNKDLFERLRNALPAGGPVDPPSFAAQVSQSLPDDLLSNAAIKDVLRSLPARLPLDDADVSSKYGLRRHPVVGGLDTHHGLDLVSRTGDDTVRAVRGGRVRVAANTPGYGKMVILSHPSGVETLYAHLAHISVREGQRVAEGVMLGIVGNTGVSTGKHLHYEVRVDGSSLNPDWVIRATRHVQ
jgi:murein DD-endopeptidase MepM/ murein hydrolase activator NlpD